MRYPNARHVTFLAVFVFSASGFFAGFAVAVPGEFHPATQAYGAVWELPELGVNIVRPALTPDDPEADSDARMAKPSAALIEVDSALMHSELSTLAQHRTTSDGPDGLGAVSHDPWAAVRFCESSGNYAINTGNGFFGAYQFTLSTWDWVAEIIGRHDLVAVRPDLALPVDQDRLAQALGFEIAGGGLGHWPVCGARYG